MSRKTAFVYDDKLTRHVLSEGHPMKPVRLQYTFDLLDAYGAFDPPNAILVEPREATEEEILTYHDSDYLRAVQSLGRGETTVNPRDFNFGPGDNPYYEGIYEAAAWSSGASVTGAELLASGEADAAFSISGGLHHAMPGYAYGFCVFNDPVIAINSLVSQGLRVAYVDIDCHHGDGVQHAYYDTDAVLTISLHESGAFLFPGTGFTQEIGAGRGRGYSVNLPLYPYTTDEVYRWAFQQVVPRLLEAFRPDVLVTQLGVDAHFRDPITHLGLTVQGFGSLVTEFANLRPQKWLALGGGGYDLQAVARSWALAYAVMSEQELPDEIPESYKNSHGVDTLSDSENISVTESVEKDVKAFAESSVTAIQRLVFPLHGIPAA